MRRNVVGGVAVGISIWFGVIAVAVLCSQPMFYLFQMGNYGECAPRLSVSVFGATLNIPTCYSGITHPAPYVYPVVPGFNKEWSTDNCWVLRPSFLKFSTKLKSLTSDFEGDCDAYWDVYLPEAMKNYTIANDSRRRLAKVTENTAQVERIQRLIDTIHSRLNNIMLDTLSVLEGPIVSAMWELVFDNSKMILAAQSNSLVDSYNALYPEQEPLPRFSVADFGRNFSDSLRYYNIDYFVYENDSNFARLYSRLYHSIIQPFQSLDTVSLRDNLFLDFEEYYWISNFVVGDIAAMSKSIKMQWPSWNTSVCDSENIVTCIKDFDTRKYELNGLCNVVTKHADKCDCKAKNLPSCSGRNCFDCRTCKTKWYSNCETYCKEGEDEYEDEYEELEAHSVSVYEETCTFKLASIGKKILTYLREVNSIQKPNSTLSEAFLLRVKNLRGMTGNFSLPLMPNNEDIAGNENHLYDFECGYFIGDRLFNDPRDLCQLPEMLHELRRVMFFNSSRRLLNAECDDPSSRLGCLLANANVSSNALRISGSMLESVSCAGKSYAACLTSVISSTTFVCETVQKVTGAHVDGACNFDAIVSMLASGVGIDSAIDAEIEDAHDALRNYTQSINITEAMSCDDFPSKPTCVDEQATEHLLDLGRYLYFLPTDFKDPTKLHNYCEYWEAEVNLYSTQAKILGVASLVVGVMSVICLSFALAITSFSLFLLGAFFMIVNVSLFVASVYYMSEILAHYDSFFSETTSLFSWSYGLSSVVAASALLLVYHNTCNIIKTKSRPMDSQHVSKTFSDISKFPSSQYMSKPVSMRNI